MGRAKRPRPVRADELAESARSLLHLLTLGPVCPGPRVVVLAVARLAVIAGAVYQRLPARAPTTGQAVRCEQDDDDASTAEAYNLFSVKFMQRTAVRRAL